MPSVNAVILCAGRGTRYAGIGNEIPKCLIDLNGELVIDRQMRLLRANGINDITVVVGKHPKHKKIHDAILEHISAWTLEIEMPQKGKYPNEVYTMVKSQHLFNNTLILLGDVVFSDNVLKQIIKEQFDDVMFIRGSGRPEVFAILTHKNFMKDYEENFKYWEKMRWEIKIRNLIDIVNPKIFIPDGLIYDIDYPWDLEHIKKELYGETRKTM